MKKYIISAAMVVASVTMSNAQDAGKFYFGTGFANINYDESGTKFSSSNINLTAGYEVSNYFAIEGEVSVLPVGDTITISGSTADVDLTHMGIFARVNLIESTASFVPYLRAGWVRGKATVEAGGVSISDTTTGFGYGIGGEYRLTDKYSVRLDASKANFDNSDATVIGISSVFRF